MKLEKLLHIVRPLEQRGTYTGQSGNLCLDSRQIKKNDLFIAIRGEALDGHDFLPQALKNGASVLLVEQWPEGRKSNAFSEESLTAMGVLVLRVEDTRKIAGPLAQAMAGYPAKTMKIAGITGTNGKTTVATLANQVLEKLGYHTGLIGTVQTRIGNRSIPGTLTTPDPVTLAYTFKKMAEADSAFALLEVSSHALHQNRTDGIRFDIAGFTNISQDHLDYHKSMEAYVGAKKRLFLSLDSEAIAIINRDDPYAKIFIQDCKADIWEFGFDDTRTFSILDESRDGMVLDLDGTLVSTPLTGRYNAYNVAQAYLICLALGCSQNNIAAALSDASGARGRMERITLSKDDFSASSFSSAFDDTSLPVYPAVFVDYAHTPDALEKVLQALGGIKKKGEALHVIFGCGGNRDVSKRPQMGAIADKYADVVTLTSDNPRDEKPEAIIRDIRRGMKRRKNLFIEPERRRAIRSAIRDADTASILLLAGKGHEKIQEIRGKRRPFDDCKIAQEALKNWVERRTPIKDYFKKEEC